MADLSKELNKELSKDFAYCEDALGRAENAIGNLPSAQPEKRTEKRTETHACDLIDREAAVDAIYHHLPSVSRMEVRLMLHEVPSAQPEPVEDCDTCKHGYFGDSQRNNCRMRFPSHYEREEEQHEET